MSAPRFIGALDVRWLGSKRQGRWERELLAPLGFVCWLKGERHLNTAEAGFVTDYASAPFVVRKFIPPTGRYTPATVIHDWLYKNRIGTRQTADRIFLEAMKVCGVNWALRSMIYRGVRVGGASGWGR